MFPILSKYDYRWYTFNYTIKKIVDALDKVKGCQLKKVYNNNGELIYRSATIR